MTNLSMGNIGIDGAQLISSPTAGELGQQCCDQPALPWSIQQQITTLLPGAHTRLIDPVITSTTPCEL